MAVELRILLGNLSSELKSQDMGDGREERRLYNYIDYMLENSLHTMIPEVIVNLLQSIYEKYKNTHRDSELAQLTEIFKLLSGQVDKVLCEKFDISEIIRLYEKDDYVLERQRQEIARITLCTQDYEMITHQTNKELRVGDVLVKKLPYGQTTRYRITKVTKVQDAFGFPSYYKIQFVVEDIMSVNNNISISNNSAPINVNSTNVNSFNNDSELFEKMLEIAKEINNDNIIRAIQEMKENCHNKKSFKEKYAKFIGAIADYMTIFAPFIELLKRYLL